MNKKPVRLQDELIRKMTGLQRLKIAFELNDFARKLIRNAVKKDNPSIGESAVDGLVAERFRR